MVFARGGSKKKKKKGSLNIQTYFTVDSEVIVYVIHTFLLLSQKRSEMVTFSLELLHSLLTAPNQGEFYMKWGKF